MEYQLKTVNRRVTSITKERDEDGTWKYTVAGKDGGIIAEIAFKTGPDFDHRLTNGDLLEIVRDRLEALNKSPRKTFRTMACLQHVTEAIFWANVPSFIYDHDEESEGE